KIASYALVESQQTLAAQTRSHRAAAGHHVRKPDTFAPLRIFRFARPTPAIQLTWRFHYPARGKSAAGIAVAPPTGDVNARPSRGGRARGKIMLWLIEQFLRSKAKILTLAFFTFAALC